MTPTIEWGDLDAHCRSFAHRFRLANSDWNEFVIVGLSRGGLIPGVLISHELGLPFVPVTYSSKKGKGQTQEQHKLPDLPRSKVLVVDDIVDTGHTMEEVVEHYLDLCGQYHNVQSYAVYHKEESVIRPTYSSFYITNESGWIVFPWEK